MSCTVCQHPQCREIDQALIAKTATLAAISQQHGLSQTALHRHKQHLLKKMQQAKNRFQDNLLLGYCFKLNIFLELTAAVANAAQVEGNSGLILRAASLGTRLIKFMTKLDFNPDPETVYRLLAEPEWASQGSLLPTDPRFLHGTLQTLAQSLSSLCPDPADQDKTALAEGGLGDEADSEIPAGLNLDLLQNLVSELTQSFAAAPGSPSSAFPPKRKNGGKKPEKSRPQQNFCQENRKDNQSDKNFAKNPGLKLVQNHNTGTANRNLPHLLETRNSALDTPRWLQAIDARLLDVPLNAIGAGRCVNPDLEALLPLPDDLSNGFQAGV